jgi:phospholipid transport system substrate-binding protein
MSLRRHFLAAIACAPLLGAFAAPAFADPVPPAQAKAFIQQSGDKLVAVVNSSASVSQKADQLRTLVDQIVAVDQVGNYVLGRFVHVATPQQHEEFLKLFHQLLSYNITYQIRAYQGITFTVNGASAQGNDTVVDTTIASPGKSPVSVGWAVDEVSGQPKIVDVIVAGTSLRITTRNDYASVITDHGGNVSALLSAMQSQIAKISNKS